MKEKKEKNQETKKEKKTSDKHSAKTSSTKAKKNPMGTAFNLDEIAYSEIKMQTYTEKPKGKAATKTEKTVGGGVKKQETPLQAILREIYEELGLRIPKERFNKLSVYGEPGRIAAYQDGSIWRMVIVVFGLELDVEPEMKISSESRALRFFTREELKDIKIVVTHSDIVDDWFLNR